MSFEAKGHDIQEKCMPQKTKSHQTFINQRIETFLVQKGKDSIFASYYYVQFGRTEQ